MEHLTHTKHSGAALQHLVIKFTRRALCEDVAQECCVLRDEKRRFWGRQRCGDPSSKYADVGMDNAGLELTPGQDCAHRLCMSSSASRVALPGWGECRHV